MMSRKTMVSAAALLLASAGAAAAFPATATTDLNVRSGPGTGYSVVDQLQAGETVEVTGQQGSWYQVDGQGWASGNYLDAQGGRSAVIIDRGYDYGPTAFYYGEDPYYWDDAGFYFYVRDGRRHRVGWDWFRDRDHRRDFRWSDNRRRGDFERRYSRYDNDGDRRRVSNQDQRSREGDLNRNGEMRRGERVDEPVRAGRASAEPRRDGTLNGRDNDRGRRGDGQRNGQPRVLEDVPGGGY
jgi:uncharacterized protein YraI